MRHAVFTSASFAYLDRARVLFQTLREFHSDWEIWLCLVDDEPEGFKFDPSEEQIDYVVRASELGIENYRSWAFQHDVVELCTAVKGAMASRLLDDGVDRLVYLDPDIALFSPLSELDSLLEQHSAVLTPHQLHPDRSRETILDNEIGSLKFGIYNLGFLAISNGKEGRALAHWWRDRLLSFCFDDVPNGLFTDQKWFNHVPVFFPSVGTIRHPGYNVASWNLSRRAIAIDRQGGITAGGSPLRFFHFTKASSVGEQMLERYSNGRLDIFELLEWYRRQLRKHAVEGLPKKWWSMNSYDDGRPISQADRFAHRQALLEGLSLADPFASPRAVTELYARSRT